MNNTPFFIANTSIQPGERKLLQLRSVSLYTRTKMHIPVHVMHGKTKGPCLFILSAVHGDEINGVEIIRRLLLVSKLKQLCGTLIAVPVANVYGFLNLSRYLPDRRDLNRSFPGSAKGSLTSRVAHLIMEEIINKSTHGIDLHTGNIHSENFPHIRTNIDIPGAKQMAKAFNVPVILNAKLPDGSVRQSGLGLNIPVLVYEGGEALRFNEIAIRIGLRGILNVMRQLKMLPKKKIKRANNKIIEASYWQRAPKSGIFLQLRSLGNDVDRGEKLAHIIDPFTNKISVIYSSYSGIIIGRNTLPLVTEGDCLFHIARIKNTEDIEDEIQELQVDLRNDPYAFTWD